MNIRRPRVLLVSKDPPGTETHLLRTLEAGQFDVQMAPQGVPDKLDEFQIVAFNNWDLESIPAARKATLEKFVQEGGGLLWIAGERNVFVENKPPGDQLDRALAGQARSAALARRHGRDSDHRQIVVDGRQEDGAGAAGGDRRDR